MARSLNKLLLLIFLFALKSNLAQNSEDIHRPKDYKDKEEFEKFYKRRKIIGNWQINQLKEGALVVRLKTNKLLVDALIKQGDKELAEQKRLEMAAININTMRAYRYMYNFSKIYFIFSNSSDSLLRGARTNIFLDSNLHIDPSIVMKEKFYLLAERDHAYNSSIGFVKEDSARTEVEKGNPVKEMAVVVKNKYGHQLKHPFPYCAGDRVDLKKKSNYVDYVTIDGRTIPFNIGNTDINRKTLVSYDHNGSKLILSIPKYLTYEKLSLAIDNFNTDLNKYYQMSPPIDDARMPEEVKKFLY